MLLGLAFCIPTIKVHGYSFVTDFNVMFSFSSDFCLEKQPKAVLLIDMY